MTLTKNNLIEAVHTCCGFPKTKSTELIESIIELVKSHLEQEENVMISGFGKFCVRNKRERRGRNPATGNALVLAPRKVVTFKYSGKLRSKLNGVHE
ncbi:MAG TPA: integration host factor subunit alpha [Thermodesulfobacteriota bacterium]|nr:integration host factor subunit alpha [Deltaproteobacteria bacterium]HNR12349.1 integration host factor subunit alpha [Thermodesulfobacteriota bacterium]HNU72421.1 integration host factor subunit alpha [Thermodesulfobacteriota bacterium]HOC37999.1 integration host factor subunit alpha [Thermodesulfobacteriota bacterium]